VDASFHRPNAAATAGRSCCALVGDVKHLAYDRLLDDADRARRIRGRFGVHDGRIIDDDRIAVTELRRRERWRSRCSRLRPTRSSGRLPKWTVSSRGRHAARSAAHRRGS
jgi:hypothetical protein